MGQPKSVRSVVNQLVGGERGGLDVGPADEYYGEQIGRTACSVTSADCRVVTDPLLN